MNATCEKCGVDLGGVEVGVPVTTNMAVRYEHGSAEVRWVDGRVELWGHTCAACESKAWAAKLDRVRAAGHSRIADKAASHPEELTALEYAILDRA